MFRERARLLRRLCRISNPDICIKVVPSIVFLKKKSIFSLFLTLKRICYRFAVIKNKNLVRINNSKQTEITELSVVHNNEYVLDHKHVLPCINILQILL